MVRAELIFPVLPDTFHKPINGFEYHRLHYALGSLRYASIFKAVDWLAESIKKYREDKLCSHHADLVLSITDWESRFYWTKFVAPAKILTTPFYLTDFYLQQIASRTRLKSNICVCLMSTFIGPFLYDALNHFQKQVKWSGPKLPEWDFIVTGKIRKKWRRRQKSISYSGLVDSPLDILCEAKAMCILSNLGYGFKTKILESIMCGCYVVIPRKLYNRLPETVQPFCKVVDLSDRHSFQQALHAAHDPLPPADPNEHLKKQAHASYIRAFSALPGHNG